MVYFYQLELNSMDIFINIFYVKFVAHKFQYLKFIFSYTFFYIVVCLIGCFFLQYSKLPWNYTIKAIEKLNNKDKRTYFINDLDALYQKHKYDSEKLYFEPTDLVIGHAIN